MEIHTLIRKTSSLRLRAGPDHDAVSFLDLALCALLGFLALLFLTREFFEPFLESGI